MIQSSFQIFRGISAQKERSLWEQGVSSWDEYSRLGLNQLTFVGNGFGKPQNCIESYTTELRKGNHSFFAKVLPKPEQYRLALEYPQQTMFLDIETTGLSRYYDKITIVGWSINGVFKIAYEETGFDELFRDLNNAAVLVTFNGAIFDVPFLRNAFTDLSIPEAHVDLRFFSKRVGLTGGQKAIEPQVGYIRDASIGDIDGKEAPILWYKYCGGDIDSLRKLITYNHSDIEGMKRIMDYTCKKYLEEIGYPQYNSIVSFAEEFASSLNFEDPSEGPVILKYSGRSGPKIFLKDMIDDSNLLSFSCVGIDLTGSENRKSGCCYLKQNKATTCLLSTDKEIFEFVHHYKPTLVSIDSPLSLPKGRISVFDDDPGRDKFGIMRQCERELKKRGINVYPALIPSMQKLTARGIKIAGLLRSMGIPVIESYPGAAQDIMNIPRKGASEEYLKIGLSEFGLSGKWVDQKVSHDELDAITSAVVGVFFWAGMFESLGSLDEDYLIIPKIPDRIESVWAQYNSIGLSGPIAAGKTKGANFIKDHGFAYIRFSLVLKSILKERGLEENRENFQKIGNEINKELGQRWLCWKLYSHVRDSKQVVIDGLRHPEDHAFLVERYGPSLLSG